MLVGIFEFDVSQQFYFIFPYYMGGHDLFELWFTSLDACYAKAPLRPANCLIKHFEFKQTTAIEWPKKHSLPELAYAFMALQSFLQKQSNWMKCKCSQGELEIIQGSLNKISIFLVLEKNYARNYWSLNKRRIQASVVHFFMLLFNLAYSLMPAELATLLECKKADKLCTSLTRMETLINDILEFITPIYQFMGRKEFKEEKRLTNNFFQLINTFFQQLPKLQKKDLTTIPRIMQYINIINPIEISIAAYQIPTKRAKAKTADVISQHKVSDNIESSSESRCRFFNGSFYTVRELAKSCMHFGTVENQEQIKIPKLFEFNESMRKLSIQLYKKQTMSTNRKQTLSIHPKETQSQRKKSKLSIYNQSSPGKKEISSRKETSISREGKGKLRKASGKMKAMTNVGQTRSDYKYSPSENLNNSVEEYFELERERTPGGRSCVEIPEIVQTKNKSVAGKLVSMETGLLSKAEQIQSQNSCLLAIQQQLNDIFKQAL